ncbi:MAG: peptidylprolyl isomerase [Bacillales bacterium]|nr:peptidylprolyl isomerase [Bacillales bacterium]
MKKRGLLALCLSTVLVISACGSNEKIAETSAGDITKEELYTTLKDLRGATAIQSLVYEKLLSEKFNVDDEVKEEMDKLKEQYGDSLLSLIQQQIGVDTIAAYEQQLKLNLLINKYVTSKIEITDEELQTAYKEYQPEIRASHILIGSDVENAEQKAKDLKKQLDEGADFAKLAKENSTDTVSAANGGDLGFFGPGDMVSEFEDAAYNLKVGEISDVVESQFGYHIIKLVEKPEKGTFEELESELREQIAQGKITTELTAQYLDELIQESKVNILDKDLSSTFISEENNTNENNTDSESNTDENNANEETNTNGTENNQ